MSSSAPCPALCCCRRPLHPGPGQESPQRFVPGPPDPASASSFQLYRLHHFHLGLELRPDTRDLSGCLVLEFSPLVPGGPALVLDTHPVVRVSSVRCRRGGRHGDPSDGSPPHGDPIDGSPPHGDPSDGSPPHGDPSDGSPSHGDPSDGSPSHGDPSDGSPPHGDPSDGSAPHGDPSDGSPPHDDRSDACPPHGDPTDCSPPHGDPTDGSPPLVDPAYNTGVSEVPTSALAHCASPGSPRSTAPLWCVAQEPSEYSPVMTPEPLDLSVSQNLNYFPSTLLGDITCSPESPSPAGPGDPIVNGHQPPASALKPTCPVPLNPLAVPYSPAAELSFHSSSSCYTLSPDSLVFPTLEISSAPAVAPPHFTSMDIAATEDLNSTFSHPCGMHNASDCGLPHCTCCFPLDFRVDEFTDYGSALIITVPETLQTNEMFQVIVHYVTGEGPAVWWLDPELSYGSSELFVFTQGHSVCNRSFFPCFDTPAVKCTYSASVKAPAGIRVLMSCTHSYYVEEMGIFNFYMEHPVPVYLVALAAGHLLPADVGPRSRVWAEPCVLPLAVGKLSGRVEQWLQAAESLYGPYIWGRYDIVFLPPSFPIVAMENPCLTFVICSILDSEDFLLIDVIHEIAHGWFGNAVTNASWEEMWLSEGLATYAQRRITTLVYGASFTCLETTFRLEALNRQIRILGQDTPFSRLQAKLDPGVNPSNLMNLFTYEKGFCFVHYLSQLCGDQDNFDAFLRDYIERFKFRSVLAHDLLESYLSFFPHLKGENTACSEGVEFERWLNAPGPPLTQPDLSQGSIFTSPVETLTELWMAEPLDIEAACNFANITDWQTFQTVLFLDKLLDQSPLRPEVMLQLSLCYSGELATMNTEIRIRWLQIVVRNNFQPDLPRVRHFLLCQTSRMYTIPLYEDLSAGPLKSCALEIFYQTHGRLHPNLRKTVQQILAQGGSVVQSDTALPVVSTELCTQGSSSLRDVNVTA